jgi:hypothetical protein
MNTAPEWVLVVLVVSSSTDPYLELARMVYASDFGRSGLFYDRREIADQKNALALAKLYHRHSGGAQFD